jgi:hypothetical protein
MFFISLSMRGALSVASSQSVPMGRGKARSLDYTPRIVCEFASRAVCKKVLNYLARGQRTRIFRWRFQAVWRIDSLQTFFCMYSWLSLRY